MQIKRNSIQQVCNVKMAIFDGFAEANKRINGLGEEKQTQSDTRAATGLSLLTFTFALVSN